MLFLVFLTVEEKMLCLTPRPRRERIYACNWCAFDKPIFCFGVKILVIFSIILKSLMFQEVLEFICFETQKWVYDGDDLLVSLVVMGR